MRADKAHDIINKWIEKYSDTLHSYVYKRVPDKTSVKDILQDTFIAAWKNYDSFKNEADEKTWLFAILKNKLIDYYRLQSRSITQVTATGNFFDKADHWTEKAAPNQWHNADSYLNKKEFFDVFNLCNSKLNRLQQLAFTMKYIDDEETDFVCKVLNITASNYWVIIHRCKLNLRQCLEKNWFLKDKK